VLSTTSASATVAPDMVSTAFHEVTNTSGITTVILVKLTANVIKRRGLTMRKTSVFQILKIDFLRF
jgi:hypothetical protein